MKPNEHEWPPPVETTKPKPADKYPSIFDSWFGVLVGVALGFLLNVMTVAVGSLLILIFGTMILGPTQYGQTTYKPILPFFVLDILFVLSQCATILLFFRVRLRKTYYAYGIVIGGVSGTIFLLWCWKVMLTAHP